MYGWVLYCMRKAKASLYEITTESDDDSIRVIMFCNHWVSGPSQGILGSAKYTTNTMTFTNSKWKCVQVDSINDVDVQSGTIAQLLDTTNPEYSN